MFVSAGAVVSKKTAVAADEAVCVTEAVSEEDKPSRSFTTPLLNNALPSANAGGCAGGVPPPPAASFIANDLTYLKKRSNADEEDRNDFRHHKTTSTNCVSQRKAGASAVAAAAAAAAAPAETPVKRQYLVDGSSDLQQQSTSAAAAAAAAALRRSKASKRKNRRSDGITDAEHGLVTRLLTVLALWLRSFVNLFQPHVCWLLWDVLWASSLAAGQAVWLRVAGATLRLRSRVAVTGRSFGCVLWRRLRCLLPSTGGSGSGGGGGGGGGGRHGSGRRKKTGSRKPAWMPAGLQANIDLPDTGEDAMKRLLACKEKDAYSVLGVRRDASEEDITHYYRRQALLVHPDKNMEPGASEAFKILAGAFELVGASEQRREYDAALETARLQSEEAMEQFSDMVTKLQVTGGF